MLFIHPGECIDCGLCVSACPVDAIYEEDYVPEQWASYIALNAAVFDNSA
jgi:ferredoxin